MPLNNDKYTDLLQLDADRIVAVLPSLLSEGNSYGCVPAPLLFLQPVGQKHLHIG